MALSAKEFRDIERRKMRLQADIAARRNSLMTMGNASIVPRPDELPSKFDKAVADANNAAALKHLENSGNEFGPQSLNTLAAKGLIMDPFNSLNLYPQVTSSPFTKALNTRAANLTADDQHRVKNRTFGRGYSEGAIASLSDKSPSRLYDPSLLAAVDGGVGQDTGVDRRTHPAPTWRPPMRYPGVNPERTQSSSPSQASMPNQTGNYGPGLTPAAAEELYGPGGMYGTQPLARGLYQGKTSSTSGGGSAPQSASQGLADSIRQIKKRAGIIRGTAALMGGDTRAADRYEAKAMASLGVYAGQYALSNLDDADFQSKRKLFQALLKNGMPIDQVLNVIQSGVADVPTTKLKDQQKQVFVDAEGNEHAGKIAWNEKGDLRYLKRDGTAAPDDWVPRQASSTNINLPGAEKPDPAIKKTMIKRAAAMMEEARKYWLDEDGKLHEELNMWDALGWRGPARTTKLKMARALSIALRLESGAAIGEDERAQFYDLFMPNAKDWLTGDKEAVIVDKFNDFQKYIEMIVDMIDPKWEDEDKREAFREVVEKAKDERERNIPLDMD